MPTARELLEGGERRLTEADVPSPRVDAEMLLAHVVRRPRALVRASGEVPSERAAAFADLIERRAERVPLQHLTGSAPFRYLELAVGPGVFVPRPETELLVDAVLAHLNPAAQTSPRASRSGGGATQPAAHEDARQEVGATHRGSASSGDPASHRGSASSRGSMTSGGSATLAAGEVGPSGEGSPDHAGPILVDLCTGSGALALSLAHEVPGCTVHAVELDERAAGWARRNVGQHAEGLAAVRSSVHLHVTDAACVADPGGPLASLAGQVAVVVTNPPYIPDAAIPRDPEVRDHDPAIALFGGPDGLDVVRRLADQAAALLQPGGLLAIEHADVQGEAGGAAGVPGVLRGSLAWRAITDHLDLNGLPRFTTAVRPGATRTPLRHPAPGSSRVEAGR